MSSPDTTAPFRGLAAFYEEHSSLFFGREAETADLLNRVGRNTLTVLFGQSGLGKTSLLNAGLFPALRRKSYLPVYIRLDYSEGAASLAQQILSRLAAVYQERLGMALELSTEGLWETLHTATPRIAPDAQVWIPVLVFDQFEELFTLGERVASVGGNQEFLFELTDVVENRVPARVERLIEADPAAAERFDLEREDYRILLCLREDYLPHLEELRQVMPSMMVNRMRLRQLAGDRALEAVIRPVPDLVPENVGEQIVRFVAKQKVTSLARLAPWGISGQPPSGQLASLEVEPPLLSLLCSELNEGRKQAGLQQITADLISGNVHTILERYYNRCVADQPLAVREFIEEELLTEQGYRESVALDRATALLAARGVRGDVIPRLVDRRLLRTEERGDVPRVEIVHDVLAGVVKLERERRKARSARAQQLLASLGGGLLWGTALLLLLGALYFFLTGITDPKGAFLLIPFGFAIGYVGIRCSLLLPRKAVWRVSALWFVLWMALGICALFYLGAREKVALSGTPRITFWTALFVAFVVSHLIVGSIKRLRTGAGPRAIAFCVFLVLFLVLGIGGSILIALRPAWNGWAPSLLDAAVAFVGFIGLFLALARRPTGIGVRTILLGMLLSAAALTLATAGAHAVLKAKAAQLRASLEAQWRSSGLDPIAYTDLAKQVNAPLKLIAAELEKAGLPMEPHGFGWRGFDGMGLDQVSTLYLQNLGSGETDRDYPLADHGDTVRPFPKLEAAPQPPPAFTTEASSHPRIPSEKPASSQPPSTVPVPATNPPPLLLPPPNPADTRESETSGSPAPKAEALKIREFRDDNLAVVLHLLAAETGRQLIIPDQLPQKVTLSRREVTADALLTELLETYQLQSVEAGDFLVITRKGAEVTTKAPTKLALRSYDGDALVTVLTVLAREERLEPSFKGVDGHITAEFRDLTAADLIDRICIQKELVANRGEGVIDFRPLQGLPEEPLSTTAAGTLEFEGEEIASVLRTLARQARLNLVVSANVKGTVTMRLEGKTPREAIEIIVDAKGLVMKNLQDVYYVVSAQELGSYPRSAAIPHDNDLSAAYDSILSNPLPAWPYPEQPGPPHDALATVVNFIAVDAVRRFETGDRFGGWKAIRAAHRLVLGFRATPQLADRVESLDLEVPILKAAARAPISEFEFLAEFPPIYAERIKLLRETVCAEAAVMEVHVDEWLRQQGRTEIRPGQPVSTGLQIPSYACDLVRPALLARIYHDSLNATQRDASYWATGTWPDGTKDKTRMRSSWKPRALEILREQCQHVVAVRERFRKETPWRLPAAEHFDLRASIAVPGARWVCWPSQNIPHAFFLRLEWPDEALKTQLGDQPGWEFLLPLDGSHPWVLSPR